MPALHAKLVENGVVFGQYANGYFSGLRVNNSGTTSVFHQMLLPSLVRVSPVEGLIFSR